MQHRRVSRLLWLACLASLLLAGLLSLAGFALRFEQLKPVADRLARDGSLDLFTPRLLASLKPGLLIAALACLIAAVLVYLARDKLQAWLDGMLQASPRQAAIEDARELGVAFRSQLQYPRELAVLAAITILAAAIRLLYIAQPVQHDEAYTFIAFASRPLWYAISDYSLPNNHIFHTLLVYLAYHLLGNQPWVIRLPAFMAGVAIIPLTYLAGAVFYSRKAGLLSAALAAISPLLINYSANARGYTLICAFTLFIVILAAYVKDHPNRLAWGLFVLASALGFYTIPIMLYPFGMVLAWLALSHLLGDTSPQYGSSFWKTLLISCLMVVGLVALLYMPVFINTGFASVVNNSYVRPDDTALTPILEGGLLEQVGSRIASTASQWSAGLPPTLSILSLVGFIASLAMHRRLSRYKIPLQVAALLWIVIAITLQRVAPLARVWMFLLPLFITWSVAGLLGLARPLVPPRFHWQASWLVLAGAILLPAVLLVAAIPQTESMRGAPGAEEGIALYLRDHLQPGDRVAVKSPISTPLQYYFLEYGLPMDSFEIDAEHLGKVWVVVSQRYDQTLEIVLERRKLEALTENPPDSPVYQYKHISVFELGP